MKGVRALAVLVMLFSASVEAHEVRPAYLELRQTGAETYDALWKVPGRGDNLRLGLYVELPASCTNVSEPRGVFVANAFTERWSFRCPGGLTGSTIRIAGLSATMTDVLVRLERLDGTTQASRLTPSAASLIVAAAPSATQVARTYLSLGVEHILGGMDHLLFVLALLLLVRGWRRIVVTVTAFTVAHSLTLGAATLGVLRVSQQPIEAVIALSIAFVAAELLRGEHRQSLTARWPWIVAFTFGLLHGFGFAGALSEVGLPQSAIPLALLFFNVGVEVGQLLFIAVVLATSALGRVVIGRLEPGTLGAHLSSFSRLAPPYAIGSVAMFWVIQRIAAF
jgi:hypothetical protein